MKAIHMHGRGGPERLVYEDVPQPHPGQGEVLVRVYATGVIANELRWDETYVTTWLSTGSAGEPELRILPHHQCPVSKKRGVIRCSYSTA